MYVRRKGFKMCPINISFVILVNIIILPYCYTECENYYIIMEKTTDDLYYNPIKKENISWTLSTIRHHNETNKFDMNCVLNFNCEKVEANLNKIISTVPRLGIDTIINNKNKSSTPNTILSNTNKTDIAITPSPPEIVKEDIATSSKENPRHTSTLTNKRDDDSLDLEVKTVNASDYDSEFANPKTSGETNVTVKENTDLNKENSTNSTDTENSLDNKGLKDGKKLTDSENHGVNMPKDIKSNDIESSNVTIEKNTELTDTEVFKDFNSTIAKDEIKTSDNVNDSLANITGSDHHKYNPEDSKKLAFKVIAGISGALTAIGVCILVKYGVAKLIAHFTQAGVYRLPDP